MCDLPFVDPGLAYRAEMASAWRGVRYAEAYQRLHPTARSISIEVAGGYATFVRPGSPVNRAGGLGFRGPLRRQDLEFMEAFFYSRGARPRIHVCPLADESMIDLLHDEGYRLAGFLSVLLRVLPEDYRPPAPPPGMTITRAGPGEGEAWLRVVGQGFEGDDAPAAPGPAAESLDILGPNFYAEDGQPFFAYVDGEAAGGGGMYYNREMRAVELGGASTRLAYRRRGVQRALIEARLAAARDLGCDLAVVLTEPGSDSQRNLARAGFGLAYTKVVMEK